MKFVMAAVLVVAEFGIAATAASAQDRTIYFTGTLSAVENSPFDGIAIGTAFTGSYTYDTSVADTDPLEQVGRYRHATPPHGITVNIGSRTFRTDPSNVDFLVEVTNDYQSLDNFAVQSYGNLSSDGIPIEIISCQFDDPTHAILSSAALPTAPPNLSRWQQWIGLSISGRTEDSRFMLRGHLTAIGVEPTEF